MPERVTPMEFRAGALDDLRYKDLLKELG